MAELPDVPQLLATAVAALGGAQRDGQLAMASAVANAIDTGEHLAVQAGTGTGKSLAYLVPALRHAVATDKTVVVTTATIALQRQLIDRDLPRLTEALAESLGRTPTFAILKGRNNYLCRNKLAAEDDSTAELFDPFAASALGREIVRLREMAETSETGDRDEVEPAVRDTTWRAASVTSRECLGASRCPFGTECFAELARQRAGRADVVVTNHALLAIDALGDATVLPEHDVVIVDEAHELVDRITGVATDEFSVAAVLSAIRRAGKIIDDELADAVVGAAEEIGQVLDAETPGRWKRLPEAGAPMFAGLRDRLWAARSAIGPAPRDADATVLANRSAAITGLEALHDTLVRIIGVCVEGGSRDVVWLAADRDDRRALQVAPLAVGGLLRSKLFAPSTVVLTSATLTIGGSFDALAVQWGLPGHTGAASESELEPTSAADATAIGKAADTTVRWTGLDVGSPFDHPKAGILYVARHLPPPGRSGPHEKTLAEIVALVTAAGGRTLGLFSSQRAATAAAAHVREHVETPVLCQGDNAIGALIRDFAATPEVSLFGTLSLWQGVDVPGESLSLVIIDRIPFPRPDEPLLKAREEAVSERGGNGFMAVSANHAALLLAQGAGRLLRSTSDRGLVAVLDSRLATARYANYLLASLPPFWRTTDPQVAAAALSRLATT